MEQEFTWVHVVAGVSFFFVIGAIIAAFVIWAKTKPMNYWLCVPCGRFHDGRGTYFPREPLTAKYQSHMTCGVCADKFHLRTPHAK